MGSSKYEYNPEQFDIDMKNNYLKRYVKKNMMTETIESWIAEDPSRMKDVYNMLIDVIVDLKKKYNI